MTQELKYKVGDCVKVRQDAEDHGRFDGDIAKGAFGVIDEISDHGRFGGEYYPYKVTVGDDYEWLDEAQIELAEKSLDNLEVGDIIVDTNGAEAKVLAVLGNVFLKSAWRRSEAVNGWYTVVLAKEYGWTVKQDTPTETLTELSIAELEKKLDLTAGTLRVKKD